MKRIRIGITLGDLNGIGPEIAHKAARQRWPNGQIGKNQIAACFGKRHLELKTEPINAHENRAELQA